MNNDLILSQLYLELYKNRYNDKIIEYVQSNFKNNSIVLDVGCGPGFQAEAVSKQNYNVVGIDIDSFMIETAIKRTKYYNNLQFILNDICTYKGNYEFDFIYSLFNVMNYIVEDLKFLNAFKNMYNSLKCNGTILIEMWNGEMCFKDPPKVKTFWFCSQLLGKVKITTEPNFNKSNQICFLKTSVYKAKGNSLELLGMKEIKHKTWTINQVVDYASLAGLKLISIMDFSDWTNKDVINSWKIVYEFAKK